MSQPSKRTPQLEQEVLSRMSSGEPLAQICRDEHMPHMSTWRVWCRADKELDIAHAHARDEGFDVIAADCLLIANTPQIGEETTIKPDGAVEVKTSDMLGHRKLQIETRLKLLAKWDPKRYGEKLAIGGAHDLPPVEIQSTLNVSGLSTAALAEIMAAKDAAE
jgi:hypothetical protein